MDKKQKSVVAVAAALVVLAGAGIWLLYPRNQNTVPVMDSVDASESTSSVNINIKGIVSVTEAPPESAVSSQAQTRTITLDGELHGDVQLPVIAEPQDIPPEQSAPAQDSEPDTVQTVSDSPYISSEPSSSSSTSVSSAPVSSADSNANSSKNSGAASSNNSKEKSIK